MIAYENAHLANFHNVISPASDSLGSFDGSERITSGYVMNTTDVGALQVNVGLRVEATHASRPDALPHDLAAGLVRAWMRFPVQEITARVHESALEIEAQHGLAYWDSTVIAAAQALGCVEIHSEELRHGQQVGGLTIVNPFR